jgi:hypothetical protein
VKLSTCDQCGQSVMEARVLAGHTVQFDPEQVIGGSWAWYAEDGWMRRLGRLLRKGYQPHERTCPR